MAVVTKTLKASGGDYSLMSTWESTEQTDLVSAGDSHVLECDAFECTDSVIITGWTTDALNNITIRNATGVSTGSIGAGFRMTSATGFNGTLAVRQNYTVLSGLEVTNTRTTDATAIAVSSCDYATIEKCIVRGGTTGANSNAIAISASTVSNSFEVTNCLLVRAGGSGVSTGNYFYATLSNLTAVGCTTYGINCPGAVGSITIKNCVSYGAGTDFNITTGGTRTNNASSDTTAPGTSEQHSITSAAFNNYAGDDFSPAAGGALAGTGTDLSTEFLDDITGTAR